MRRAKRRKSSRKPKCHVRGRAASRKRARSPSPDSQSVVTIHDDDSWMEAQRRADERKRLEELELEKERYEKSRFNDSPDADE